MIRVILLVIALLLSLAIGPLLLDAKGYILISSGDTILELSVYAAIFWITAITLIMLIVIKLFRGGIKFSFGTWNKFVFASQRRGIANFNKGLAAYMLEDYSQAEDLFAKSAIPSKRKQSAYLLAASAAAKANNNSNHYLSLLDKEAEKLAETSLESTLVQVRLLINQKTNHAYGNARHLIDENHMQLGHDPRLLALHIELCLIEKHFNQAIDALPMARKEKTITETTLTAWEKSAYFGHFNALINQQDNSALQQYWTTLPRKLKQREAILLSYCRVLAEHNISEPLTKLLLPLLSKSPSSEVLKDLRHLPIGQADELIAAVQKQLHKNNQNTLWLSLLGHLALNSGQYSLAEKAFGSLIKSTDDETQKHYDKHDLTAMATTYSLQGHYQLADATWRKVTQLSET